MWKGSATWLSLTSLILGRSMQPTPRRRGSRSCGPNGCALCWQKMVRGSHKDEAGGDEPKSTLHLRIKYRVRPSAREDATKMARGLGRHHGSGAIGASCRHQCRLPGASRRGPVGGDIARPRRSRPEVRKRQRYCLRLRELLWPAIRTKSRDNKFNE